VKTSSTTNTSSALDYSSFGMMTVGRSWSGGSQYRFGFNGVEIENNIIGESTSYSFKYRIEDSRLGRFLSIDPLFKAYSSYSPYQFAANNPIISFDLEGLENPSDLNPTVLSTPDGGSITLPISTDINYALEECIDVCGADGDPVAQPVELGSVIKFGLPNGEVYDARFNRGEFTGYALEDWGTTNVNSADLTYQYSKIVDSKVVYYNPPKSESGTCSIAGGLLLTSEAALAVASGGTLLILYGCYWGLTHSAIEVNIMDLQMKSPFLWNEEVNPNDVSPVDEKLLEEKVGDLEEFKDEWFPGQGGLFDVKRNKSTKELIIVDKKGKIYQPTGIFLDL